MLLLNAIEERFRRFAIPTKDYDVDESMIRYYGGYGAGMRQCIPNKPIRMGYKVWCINSKDGYLNTFTMYQGKGSQNEYSSDYGLRLGPSKFVLDLV